MNMPPSRNNPSEFQELVAAVVASDLAEPRTRHIDAGYLPNRETVIEILKLMQELLFPGYFGRQHLTSSTLEYHVEELLRAIDTLLFEQARNAIRHHANRRGLPDQDWDQEAERVVRALLGAIPRLRAILATDVQAAFDGDPAAADFDEIIFSYPGLLAITTYRIAHELHRSQLPLIPRIMTEYAHNVTGIDIHPGAAIDEYFFIDHGTGVVIGETTHIGKRVQDLPGGDPGRPVHPRRPDPARGQAPPHPHGRSHGLLGRHHPGRRDTVIGEGAVIAGGLFVTQSVPPRTRVTGKNLELQDRNHKPVEFRQDLPADWVI